MSRIRHPNPTESTKKQILAASGNQCAFPVCSRTIVNREHGVLVGKIAHIKAQSEGGPRFDADQTGAENCSANNLLALCGEHHDIIDAREDSFTVEILTEMKKEHEDKIEKSADRSWIKPPNSITGGSKGTIKGFQQTVYFWIDRENKPQVYDDRKLTIVSTLQDIYLELRKLCDLYTIVEDNPEAPGKSLLQSQSRLDKDKSSLDSSTPWNPTAHIFSMMAEIPDITFGEIISYLVQGNDATELFENRVQVLKNKILQRQNIREKK